MLMDQRITQLTVDLAREATAAPLSPQRLARLQTLTQELAEVLTTADKALGGGLSLEGALWPERDDDEEEIGMDQEHMLMLIDVLDAAGVPPSARRDALARAEQDFGPHAVEDWEARDWAQQLRGQVPHLFTRTGSAPTGDGQGKRKALPQPSRSVSQAWDALPPMDRLRALREWQAAQQSMS